MLQCNNEKYWSQGSGGLSVGWDLDLLHVNDIHVRMEETNKYSAACRWPPVNLQILFDKVSFSKCLHSNSQRQSDKLGWCNSWKHHRLTHWLSWSPNPTDFYFWYSFVDDQHRHTNMNDKDHLVGQLTRFRSVHRGYFRWTHPQNEQCSFFPPQCNAMWYIHIVFL